MMNLLSSVLGNSLKTFVFFLAEVALFKIWDIFIGCTVDSFTLNVGDIDATTLQGVNDQAFLFSL